MVFLHLSLSAATLNQPTGVARVVAAVTETMMVVDVTTMTVPVTTPASNPRAEIQQSQEK